MNKVHTTLGRWVQRVVGKNQFKTKAVLPQQPAEVNGEVLRQVGGGAGSAQTPNKGW